ncbi:MAG: ATP synthase subunit I [Thermoanaerobaculales bacterium]
MTSHSPRDDDGFSTDRVVRIAGALVIVGAVAEAVLGRSWMGVLSLTAAGVVAIINFRWLEVVLHRVVQPGEPRFDSWSLLRILGRLVLFAGIFAALLWVPRVDPVAVALGFSALVAAILVEGLRRTRIGGG